MGGEGDSPVSRHHSKHPTGGCVCVYLFIKLHITAQSGPIILVIPCHSN